MRDYLCFMGRKFKRERETTWKYELSALVLPRKGTWKNGCQTLFTSPVKWWEGGSEGWRGKLEGCISVVEFTSWKHGRLEKRNPSDYADLGRCNSSRTTVPPSEQK